MARMDTRMPLLAQQPDFVNALARSSQAAAQTNAVQDQNALRQLYQTQGAGIAQGDPGAINALAGLDPMAALGVQDARQGMAARSEIMEQRRVAAKRQAAEYAAGLDARERAEQAARIEAGITRGIGLYQAGDLNGLNELLAGVGEEPLQSLEQFPAVAAIYGDALDALKTVKGLNAPPKAADEYERYVREEQAAGRKPLSRIEYKRASQKTTNITSDGQGGFTIAEGFGSEPPKMTVDAAKNTGFLIRMQESGKILDSLEEQGTRFGQQNTDVIPLGLGNYLRDEEFQRFDQARRDFVNALLRRESGAVISDQEFANAERQYFPQPGDSPEVIEQKRRNRANAIAGVRAGSGPGASYVDQMQPRQPQQEQAAPEVGVTEDGYRFLGGDPGDPDNWQKVE